MNDKIKQLYDLYVSNGLIKSVDFETFRNASEDQRSQLYSLGKDNGLFQTTDFGTFSSAFGGQPTIQQEQVQEPVQEPLKKKEPSSTVSSLGTTPSVSQEEPPRITSYLEQPKPETKGQVPYAIGKEPKAVEEEEPAFLRGRGAPFENLRVPTEKEYKIIEEENKKKQIEEGTLSEVEIGGVKRYVKGLPQDEQIEDITKNPLYTDRQKEYFTKKRREEISHEQIKQKGNNLLYDPQGRISPLGNRSAIAQTESNIKRETELKNISDSFNEFKTTSNPDISQDEEAKNFYLHYLKKYNPAEYKYETEKLEYNKDNPLQKQRIEVAFINKGLVLKNKALAAKSEEIGNVLSDQFFGYKMDVDKFEIINDEINTLKPKIDVIGNELSKYPKDENGNIIIDATNKSKIEKLNSLYNDGVERYFKLESQRQEILNSGLGNIVSKAKEIQDEETKNYEYAKNLENLIKESDKYPELKKQLIEDALEEKELEKFWDKTPDWMEPIIDFSSGVKRAGTGLLKGLAFMPKITRVGLNKAVGKDPGYNWADKFYDFSDELISNFEKERLAISPNAKKNIFDYEKNPDGTAKLDKDGDKIQITNWSALPYQIGNGAGNLALFIGTAGAGTALGSVSALSKIGLTASRLSKVGTFAMGYTMSANNNYEDAKANGMTEDQAMTYSLWKSPIDASVELIFPEQKLITPTIRKSAAKLTAGYISKGVPLKDAILQSTKETLKNIAGENVEELTALASDYASKIVAEKATGVDFKVDDNLMNDIKNTVLVTSIITAPFGVVGSAGRKNQIQNQSLFISANKPNDVLKSIGDLLNSKSITEDQARSATERIRTASEVLKTIPENYSDDKKANILSGLVDKKILENQKKNIDPLFHDEINQKIKEKDDELKNEIIKPDNGLTIEENTEMTELTTKKDEGKVLSEQEQNRLDYLNNFTKQYAIQEQAAGQVPVQPTTGVGEKVEGREPETKPEVVTEEGKETIAPEVKEEVKPTALSSVETTTTALESVPTDEKMNLEFTQEDGTVSPVMGNEKMLSDVYHKAVALPEDQRTDAQKQAVTLVEESLAPEIEVEKFERELAKPEAAPTTTVGISISNDKDIENLKNTARSKAQAAKTDEERQTAETKVRVLETAQRAIKTLKSILPDFDIVVHDNEGSYDSAIKEFNGNSGSRGNFSYRSEGGKMIGRIDINLSKANSRTVAHEVTHGILTKSFGENPRLFNEFRKRLSGILTSDKNKELNDFANRYVDPDTGELLDVNHEEFLAELVGMLEQQETKISVSTMQKIAALINKFVSSITGGKFTPFKDIKDTKDVVDFFNTVSGAIREGEAVPTMAREMDIVFETISKSQLPVKDIDVKSVRTKGRPGKKVSKGLAVYTRDKKKVVEEAKYLSLEYVKENAPQIFIDNANILASYPIVSGVKKFDKINSIDEAQEVYDIFIKETSSNLKYLTSQFKPEYRDISTLWYDGANIIAQDFAKTYGISEEQAAGIIASLSPQKDWYQNVRLAEMVMMSFKDNPTFTSQMIEKQKSVISEGEKPKLKAIKKAEDKYKKNKNKKNLEDLSAKKKAHSIYMDKANKIISMLESFKGKTLNEVPAYVKPYIVRLYHEINTTKDYNVLRPDGGVMGVAMNKNGTAKAKVAWGSYTEIGKAVSIYLDGSQENITKTLGEMHKIRNFYNNIIDPMSKDNDVTMDTHAVAAALLMPLSGNSKEVGQNFGTGTSNSGPLGIKGLYYAFAEGYKKAAEDLNLLPRQVQSITWEAIRGLFTNTFKSNKNEVAKIKNIWDNYVNNKIDINETRKQINESAGGIKDPTWSTEGRGPVQAELGGISKGEGVGRGGAVSERPSVGARSGKGGGVKSKSQMVAVAPYFNTQVKGVEDANKLRQDENYIKYKESLKEVAASLGFPNATIDDNIGGYENESGEKIVEISNKIDLKDATIEEAAEFAAIAAAIAPEVQEASIALRYVKENSPEHNANEYSVKVDDINKAIDALKVAGINNFSIDENKKTVSFIDVFEYQDPKLGEKIVKFVEELESKGVNYEQPKYKSIESRYVDRGERKKIFRRLESEGAERRRLGENFRPYIETAITRDAEFQGTTYDDYLRGRAGNRAFNKPLEGVNEIADGYYKRAFGEQRPKFEGITKLDKEKSKRLNDAFIKMKHAPNDPKVRAAYEQLVKETIEQYKAFIDAGYSVEINNEEPYRNSQEMIDDLRKNKRIKIFSTESGFGDTPISEKQRQENPLLSKTEFTDVNGNPLLANDLFRAVHDFFGHSELGNGFGPLGEENAWNVHARMFSPLARKAMTTETRGQNSYVNFSGINEDADKLREEARRLREEGKIEEANRVSDQATKLTTFAEQKIGLLPDEFTDIDIKEVKSKSSLAPKDINNIIKRGRASGISERAIRTVLKKQGFTDAEIEAAMGVEKGAAKKVTVSEEMLPGFDRMMEQVDGIVAKSKERGVSEEKMAENVMRYVEGSKAYENASDVQREQIIRDIEKRFGIKQKAAPKAEKILGTIKDAKKVTMSEKEALVKQIKDQARGAKDAKSAMRKSLDFVSRTVKELAKSGKISVKQAANVLRKFSSVNPLSKESVDRFVDYMGKVFADADYSNKLSFALDTRRSISKLSKNKDKDANLRGLGEKFSQIDPSMVENIDEYNEMASAIKESIKGSTYRRETVMPAQMVDIEKAMEYVNKTMAAQKKKMTEIKAAEIQEMMGVDVSDLSYDQMMQMLDSKEPITKYNEGIIRGTIEKMFNAYSSIINQIIDSGIDPMTGDSADIKASKKALIKKFMEMDLNILTAKEALQAVDALNNFIVNKSTAKMQTVLSDYTGEANARKVEKKGITAKPLKMYWLSSVGRFFGEQFTALPLLIERMFKGVIAGTTIENAMGVTELKNKKAEAENRSNRIVEEYINKFYKSKSNGEAFDTEANVTERGMAAFMSRSVTGTEEEMQQDFNRRKKLIEESIDALSKGSEKEQAKAKLYKDSYDKILKDSNSIEDVRRKTDKNNLAAVDFWVENWSSIYDELADVSENVYNKILDKDVNYTPDRFSRLERAKEKVELSNDESVFHGNTNALYKKETGVLMKAERPESLPTDDKGKKPMMYIDLSFDMNNANSMYDAMVDINTAAPIRQIESFLNSNAFDSIVPEVKDARLLKDRIQLYVRNIRGKNVFENDTFAAMMRKLNTISAIGVGQALGGILQPLKQTIPVAMNTLVNAGGLDVGSVFSQSKMSFIDNSGYSIANRGIESQTQLKSINRLMDLAAESKGIKALKFIEKANKIWLDIFLVKPDVFIARASWMTYYEQSLKKQGINPSGIDYNTHKLNKEAADYAQSMVDRQQNISDADLQGKMFSSKTALNQLFVKTLLPFANFRMNQYMRLTSDVATLTSMTSSKEDRIIAARSLSGFGVEMATFSAISIGAAYLLGSLSKWLMGEEEDEEEEKKRLNNIIKGRVTGVVTDVISPLPFLDKPIAAGVNMGMDKVQEAMDIAKEERLSIFADTKTDMTKSLGTLGIALDRGTQLYELYKLSTDGEYTDDYGNKKKISDDNMEYLQYMTGVALLTNIGLMPSEANTVVRNSIRDAKAQGKTEKTIEREKETEKKTSEERSLLNQLMQEETDDEIIDAIKRRVNELEDTSEERKEKNKAKKEEKKALLKGYESMTDMKRYDPELYEETFGKESPYYDKYKDDILINKSLNKLRRDIKDEEMEYVPKPKKKKGEKESFGSQEFGGKKFGEQENKKSGFGTVKFGQ